jgi:hypothetical protein
VVGIAAWTRNGAQNVNFATPASETLKLNPARPVTRWKDFHSRKRTLFSSSDIQKRSSPAQESKQTAREFKKLFEKSAGKEVTVTVAKDGQLEKFTFTIPEDFLK